MDQHLSRGIFHVTRGGFKNSGYGKHNGFEGVRELSRVKSVVIDYSGAARDPFVMRVR